MGLSSNWALKCKNGDSFIPTHKSRVVCGLAMAADVTHEKWQSASSLLLASDAHCHTVPHSFINLNVPMLTASWVLQASRYFFNIGPPGPSSLSPSLPSPKSLCACFAFPIPWPSLFSTTAAPQYSLSGLI